MRTIRLKYVILSLLFITAGSFAQTRKMSKTYKTSPNVKVELDSRHTNIIIENWDRNEVQIEAYLEGDTGDKEMTKKLLASWNLETSGNSDRVTIESSGGSGKWKMDMDIDMTALEGSLSELPDMLGPLMENLVGPILSNIAENPLPPGFADDMKGMKFDYDAYKKDGDKYLRKWEAEFENKFGKKYEMKMEKWAEKMEKNSEKWEKDYEMKMEAWGKDLEKDMEAWGEEFGKRMEAWGEEFGKKFEAQMENRRGPAFIMENGKAVNSKKTIKLKIPKDAKLELNVRHGELKLGNHIKNLKADLSHSRLSANRISGKNTNISAAYSPVKVAFWEYGVLSTQFVKSCKLDKVVSIKLDSNSSDVVINELESTGVLTGSFGKLQINDLGSGFETLNISLENSDLELNVPDTAFNFSFNGMQSSIKHPSGLKLKSTKSYDNEILNGYNKSRTGNSNITIKANFSDVLIN
ncbi:hypothetical protein [Christiangramia sabulilitoris]|uniref:DUF4097 domain-containing protein n=1 Tax=Christiangramia sabulilitoris TaxID=2583991 RepID=A0A550HZ30_9FLAO|nr:hypothetical protein [Christiangramia sabulilitoris]TRO63950.1 hypothetical protein FGM01_10590 [Christiangramia sabulilitoris]